MEFAAEEAEAFGDDLAAEELHLKEASDAAGAVTIDEGGGAGDGNVAIAVASAVGGASVVVSKHDLLTGNALATLDAQVVARFGSVSRCMTVWLARSDRAPREHWKWNGRGSMRRWFGSREMPAWHVSQDTVS